MNIYEAMKARRSQYDLGNNISISEEQLAQLLEQCVTLSPSAFNSQTSRVVLLLNSEHSRLWTIVLEKLKEIVPAHSFAATNAKVASFAAAYGTILFFEDIAAVKALQASFPAYANSFPTWASQSNGMLQYATWTALASEGIGASIQHYNPLIDNAVTKELNLSADWQLVAQMPFGSINTTLAPPDKKPIRERLFIKGVQK